MTRKVKKKVIKDSGHAQGRRKLIPWDSDRISAKFPSSMDVLMAWLTTPGNAQRWSREKPIAICEIIKALKKNGILHRESSDVRTKIWVLEKKFASAAAHLSMKGQTDAFQRGEADQEVVTEVLKLCPLYRELVPVFGRIATQEMVKDVANGVTPATASAGDKSNETASVAAATIVATGGSKSTAGKWKESVEKDRHNVIRAQEKIQDGNREKVVEMTVNGVNGGQKGDAGDGSKKAERENKQSSTVDHGRAGAAVENEGRGVDAAAKNQVKKIAVLATGDKSSGADGKDKIGKAEQHHHVVVKKVEGIVADVEDDDDKQSIDDDAGKDNVLENERRQGNNTHAAVSRRLKTKQQLSESEESSSEEVDSEEETRVREEEQDDDDGGEEQIQLAQPDDVAEAEEEEIAELIEVNEDEEEIAELIEVNEDEEEIAELIEVNEDEEEIAELIEVDEEDNEEVEVDEKDKNDVEEMDEIEEEEAEEKPELADAKAEKSESSSSESESEGGDNEEEVPPTQLKAASDLEEESDHDSKHDEGDDDADLEEDTQQSANQRQSTRKRSSSGDLFSLSTKRAKEDDSVTRALERKAFIERTKQERDQRDELFQLERAKLACELQAKQVQLAMEKSLARKKLLGAGIDPAEVDRILGSQQKLQVNQ